MSKVASARVRARARGSAHKFYDTNPRRWIMTQRRRASRPSTFMPSLLLLSSLYLLFSTFFVQQAYAIKFALPAYRNPPAKCIWNSVHPNQLVIVTANVAPGEKQRVDIEIVDSSAQKNQYLNKKNINGETRLAVTAHAEGDVGVCFRNYLDRGVFFICCFFLWIKTLFFADGLVLT